MGLNTILLIVILLAIFASIAGWLNTRTILKELTEIKKSMGIKDKNTNSFLDDDLDRD